MASFVNRLHFQNFTFARIFNQFNQLSRLYSIALSGYFYCQFTFSTFFSTISTIIFVSKMEILISLFFTRKITSLRSLKKRKPQMSKNHLHLRKLSFLYLYNFSISQRYIYTYIYIYIAATIVIINKEGLIKGAKRVGSRKCSTSWRFVKIA